MDIAPEVIRCRHCGVAMEAGGGEFCCHGCETAWTIIHDAGLERYYEDREAFAPRPDEARTNWAGIDATPLTGGAIEARFAIDGLTCASCVWVCEHVLKATPGVREAQVSYASGRARVVWEPGSTDVGALCDRVASLGYGPRPLKAERAVDDDLLIRLGVSAFLTMNLMALQVSLYIGWFDGMEDRFQALFRWLALALAAPVALWGAMPFHSRAVQGLKAGVLPVDVPVSLGVTLLFGHAVVTTALGGDGYLDSLAMLVTLLLAGKVVDARGRRQAAEAAASLAGRLPDMARREVGEGIEEVPRADLRPGDVLVLGPGTEVAADGAILSGEVLLQVALLTGEAEPVWRAEGASVVAGAVVVDGAARVRVEAVGEGTLLERMAAQLADAMDEGAEEPTLADRIAPWFTAATLTVAGASAAWVAAASGAPAAVERAAAILVVACPCALALSQPVAVAAGLGAAARRGLLMRSGDVLMRMADVRQVVFDKTGTLTEGTPHVVEASDPVLRLAAGLERYSRHPVARAVLAAAAERGVPLPAATHVLEQPGVGVTGCVDGVRYTLRGVGPGQVALSGPEGEIGRIRLEDVPREDARRAVGALQRRGLMVGLLTGDRAEVAERVARGLGIDEVVAERTPDEKRAIILERQGQGVLFVGDGINDGPAVAAADVGIAMGAGVASSVLVADGVLTDDSLGPLVAGLIAGSAARDAVKRNLRRSLVYNLLAVTAAVLGYVDPLVAAVLMPLSSLLVVHGAAGVEKRVAEELTWTP